MLQTSLLLMKSLNKTETPIFLSVVCSLFPKAIFLMFIINVVILTLGHPHIDICIDGQSLTVSIKGLSVGY